MQNGAKGGLMKLKKGQSVKLKDGKEGKIDKIEKIGANTVITLKDRSRYLEKDIIQEIKIKEK